MNDHPTKICDTYNQTKVRCEECMDAETEINFWHECYNGKHSKPEDCPTWYDWCNCGVTMSEEIEYLIGQRNGLREELLEIVEQNKEMKQLLKTILETDCLPHWAYERDVVDEESIAEMVRKFVKESK